MRIAIKFLCAVLLVVPILSCIGCSDNAASSVSTESKYAHRELYPDEKETDHTDTDHVFEYETHDWNGPKDYAIVVPAGDSAAKKTAEILSKYYSEKVGITLPVVDDSQKETDKEILVGKTNRAESNKTIGESDISVSVNGDKLVFDAGHSVTLETAVNRFVRLAPKEGQAYTFAVTTDFKSTLPDGYEYVWGDEFEGSEIDPTKWDLITKMSGNEVVQLSYDENVVSVADGRLKLHAIHYFDNNDPQVRYRVPGSIITQNKMNYVYGYLEIRSRVPYSPGCWASFWTQSTDVLKGKRNYDYMLEVDIYEVFFTNTKHSGLIRWYSKEFDYNSKYPDWNKGAKKGVAVSNIMYNAKDNPYSYVWELSNSLNYEYHTYAYEWTPTEMKMYIDDKCHATYDTTQSFDAHEDMASYHDPQHIIFNNHLFYPGISDASESIEKNPKSLPACHYIDYVRLYQKPGQGELYTAD